MLFIDCTGASKSKVSRYMQGLDNEDEGAAEEGFPSLSDIEKEESRIIADDDSDADAGGDAGADADLDLHSDFDLAVDDAASSDLKPDLQPMHLPQSGTE